MPLVAVVAVLVAAAVAFAVSKATSDDQPDSVRGTADAAVSAAEDLDVDAGLALMCKRPSDEDVDYLNDRIAEAKEAVGGEPDVSYEIRDVQDEGGSGRFTVVITTDEPELDGANAKVVALVDSRGGQSCISGFDEERSEADFGRDE